MKRVRLKDSNTKERDGDRKRRMDGPDTSKPQEDRQRVMDSRQLPTWLTMAPERTHHQVDPG